MSCPKRTIKYQKYNVKNTENGKRKEGKRTLTTNGEEGPHWEEERMRQRKTKTHSHSQKHQGHEYGRRHEAERGRTVQVTILEKDKACGH